MFNVLGVFRSYKYTLITAGYFCVICAKFQRGSDPYQDLVAIPSALTFLLIINILAKVKYSLIFSLILTFLVSFDAYFVYTYGNPLTVGITASIFETNNSEIKGVLDQALIPFILIFVFTLFIILKSQKELKYRGIKVKKAISFLCIYLFVFIPILYSLVITFNEKVEAGYKASPFLMIQRLSFSCMPFVYNDILAVIAYKLERNVLESYGETERVLPKGIFKRANASIPDKIYLVIGESSWRKHYSLYGYPVITTPYLDSLGKSGTQNFLYYNSISPAPMTRESLRLVLSFSTPMESKPFFEEKNIIDIANDVGYETIWLSNHEKIGLFDTYITYIASGAHYQYFSKKTIKEDLELTEKVKENYRPKKKQLFVIHLIGSHIPYEFNFDDYDKREIKGQESAILNYDRSIHHTDRVLKEVVSVLDKDESALMIYFSDHGEIIGKGHGFIGAGTSQFEIPFLVYNKSNIPVDDFMSKYMESKTDQLFNSVNLSYVLAEIMGYSVDGDRLKEAIDAGNYIFHADAKPYLYSDIEKEKS